jgi:hypothetical protein
VILLISSSQVADVIGVSHHGTGPPELLSWHTEFFLRIRYSIKSQILDLVLIFLFSVQEISGCLKYLGAPSALPLNYQSVLKALSFPLSCLRKSTVLSNNHLIALSLQLHICPFFPWCFPWCITNSFSFSCMPSQFTADESLNSWIPSCQMLQCCLLSAMEVLLPVCSKGSSSKHPFGWFFLGPLPLPMS